jgi:hypothetical protein
MKTIEWGSFVRGLGGGILIGFYMIERLELQFSVVLLIAAFVIVFGHYISSKRHRRLQKVAPSE